MYNDITPHPQTSLGQKQQHYLSLCQLQKIHQDRGALMLKEGLDDGRRGAEGGRQGAEH